ncbi:SGNH/GDSL hydrolase family protein [Reichenbachiella sp.]|uniref:SGNH/GDSL hydrolase family protein n=1 Tax=Reichenbachiella sp. TaxID=2184521 RepID=UPI00329725AF
MMGIKPLCMGLVFLCVTIQCTERKKTIDSNQEYQLITPDHKGLVYSGRIDFSNPKEPILYWAGTSVAATFQGTTIRVKLEDNGENYYKAIIDGDAAGAIEIDCHAGANTYTVADHLEDRPHTIELVRRTDSTSPATKFLGFLIERNGHLLESPTNDRLKIEFYGNSITSGHGVLDESGENNDNRATWDNYYAYGAITSRALNADYRCISMSGIGIIKSWYPLTMPEMYNRLNPNDKNSRWDFALWTPDVVVINLFQNDSWLIEQMDPVPKEKEIIDAYKNFVSTIRGHYPEASVFCVLGNMSAAEEGSPWPGYIESAVDQLRDFGDQNLYFLIFPYRKTKAHPTVVEQKEMADMLTSYIKTTLKI